MIEALETRKLLSAVVSGGVLTVNGTSYTDRIEFARGTGSITVVETTNGQVTQTPVSTAGIQKIIIWAGNGNDTIILGKVTIPAEIHGSAGNDTISAGGGNDTLFGESGLDYLFGSDGRDLLSGGTNGDNMLGGGGVDTVDYKSRTKDLHIGLGTAADDGEAGEGDNVRTDIEIVISGSGNDYIMTNSGRSVQFYGGAGNDTLVGGSGNDILDGEAGNDLLMGQGGADIFQSKDGGLDTINGGGGADSATSDPSDVISDL